MRTTQSRTVEAFSEWVDDGEVITGAATDQQIKRTPLLDLQIKTKDSKGSNIKHGEMLKNINVISCAYGCEYTEEEQQACVRVNVRAPG